jgi:DNA-binding HxlR family transcriptional regulator
MSAPRVELSADQAELLRQVRNGKVYFSRGAYFMSVPGSPNVSILVQQLRAMKLIVLPTRAKSPVLQPIWRCELTEAGTELIEQLCE